MFKQKTAYVLLRSLVGSEMCVRDGMRGGEGSLGLPRRRKGVNQGRGGGGGVGEGEGKDHLLGSLLPLGVRGTRSNDRLGLPPLHERTYGLVYAVN